MPVSGLQVSSVQGSRSLQSFGVPAPHWPPEQASSSVQGLPSSHGVALAVWTHPDGGLHESSVQSF
jgi:hypothetical protein